MTNGAHGGGKILCLHVHTQASVSSQPLKEIKGQTLCRVSSESDPFTLVQLLQLH